MLINGRPGDSVAALDRGLQYGDGLFETIAFIDGKAPLWNRHMARLSAGCRALALPQQDEAVLAAEAERVLRSGDVLEGRQVIKIIITRGEHGAAYFPGQGDATRILYRREWPRWRTQQGDEGVKLHRCKIRLATGSPFAGVKTLNRLEQVLAAAEISRADCREGLLCDADGFMVEALTSNLFWLKQDRLYTPLLDRCGVSGVMRAEVIAQAEKYGIGVDEVREEPQALESAEAIFLSNALGLMAVNEYSGKRLDVDAVPGRIRTAIKRLLS
ncbi:MAG: aminodeoxychorismate lyase [Pseudomonadota bacterium]